MIYFGIDTRLGADAKVIQSDKPTGLPVEVAIVGTPNMAEIEAGLAHLRAQIGEAYSAGAEG